MDINVLKNTIEQPNSGLVCPLCHTPFGVFGHMVRCQSGHSYNFTKPGTINFITKKMNSHTPDFYESELKLHQLSPYETLIEAIKTELSVKTNICFTGSSLSPFLQTGDIGFEATAISVISQLRKDPLPRLFVAEAACLPLCDEAMDLVLRMDQQPNMAEGLRVLKQDHFMVHILPGPRHLLEIRSHLFGGRRLGLRENQRLLKEIWAMETSAVITQEQITVPYAVSNTDLNTILDSLGQTIDPQRRDQLHQAVSTVTFDFKLYFLKKHCPARKANQISPL